MTISDEAVEAAKVGIRAHAHVDWQAEHLVEGLARAALEAAAPFIRAQALLEAAEAVDSDDEDSLYATRRRELAYPYSKPMFAEQWGELDGIESAAMFLRVRAAAERGGE